MRKYILTTVMSVVSLSMMANSLTSGLIAHWPFDGNTRDMSGHGYNLSGSVSYTADRNGNDGAASYFGGATTLTPPRDLYVANSMTISVWCKPNETVPAGYSESLSNPNGMDMPSSQYVLYPSHGGVSSTGKAGVGILVGQNGVFVIEHAHNYCPLPLVWYGSIGNNWTLVTITISANNAPTLYVNGVRIKNGLTSSKKKFIGVADDFALSRYPDYYWGTVIGNGVTIFSGSCGYNGLMDDFRIYNRALSDAEVNALYLQDMSASFYSVSFNANGGTGTIEEQVFEDSKKQKLSKNIFRKDGYVFQGWAKDSAERAELAAAGDIDVDYTDEQEITVDHDMTLYAVWVNPPLTLTAESADWSNGSITLRCEDTDTSGAEHSYTLEYCNENGTWVAVDDAQVSVAKGQNANNEEVWVARLTDSAFSSRLGGIPLVQYRVKEVKSGRESEPCVTRRRHGLFVALSEYEGGWQTAHANHTEQANSFIRAFQDYGNAYGALCRMFDRGAEKALILSEIDYLADEVVTPGDVLVFYYVGHGGGQIITCYGRNETLNASELKERLDRLRGVGVVVIMNTCYSASMISHGEIGDGMGNIGWLTSSQADEKSRCGSFTDCVLNRGWLNGAADIYGEKHDGCVTFGELALWGQDWMGKNYIRDSQLMSFYNSLALDNIVAGRVPTHASWMPLTSGPSSLTAKPGKAGEINLRCSSVGGATGYDVYCRYISPVVSSYWYVGETSGTSYIVGRTFALVPNYEYEFYVRAKNDVDVSPASPTATCTPDENTSLRDYIVSFTQRFSLLPQSFAPPVENGEVNYSNLNYDHDGDGLTTFEEYIAGSDPANVESTFISKISIGENGAPRIEWSPDTPELRATRVYRTLGKKSLADAEWVDVTDMDQSEYRFFKVSVELDDGGSNGGGSSNGGDVNLDDFVIEQGVLQGYVGDAVNVAIPGNVTSIANYGFAGNTNLVSVTIPGGVTNIGNYAFAHCSDLTNITFVGNAPSVGNNAFQGDSVCTVYVSRGSSGWGVAIPGTWNGMAIRFKEDEESP